MSLPSGDRTGSEYPVTRGSLRVALRHWLDGFGRARRWRPRAGASQPGGGREVATRVPPSQQAPQRRSVGPDGGAGAALGTEPVIKRAIEVEGGYLLDPADAAWQDAPILL